ncbi:MAG: hypothetical protein V4750_09845 [Pseudomonadota bacterium]
MSTSTNTSAASTRPRAAANAVLPQRKAPILQVAPRLPFRVLQTSRAPAQLSLFLRPSLSLR